MSAVAEQTGAWLEHFTNQAPATEPWIQALRDRAFARFAELGFPTTHDEEWRFTNVAPIARTKFKVERRGCVGGVAKGRIQLYLVNGLLLDRPGNLPKGLEADGLALDPAAAAQHLGKHASFAENAFVALNTAMIADGALVRVARGAVIEEPIEILYVTTNSTQPIAVHPRALIVVGADAHCTIVERYYSADDGAHFTNAVSEIVVGDRAVVDHYKVQQESLNAFHISTLQATIGRSAAFSSHSISLGGALVRNDVNATLSEGSDATLNGLYIV